LRSIRRWLGNGARRNGDNGTIHFRFPISSPSVTSAEAARKDRVVDQLYAAIRALQPSKRALVVLYLDGFSYREIAEVVGISESNVGVNLNRIKKELAATVQEDMYE